MSQNLKLFVNYRRADEALFVQLMRTHFMYRYGRENVFMDFDTIPPFAQFEDFIRQKVRDCDALVAVIGPHWLELMQEKEAEGKPDYVRIEIEEALKHGKIVAPICIQGARVPPMEDIPENLREVFDRNVPELQAGRHILDNVQRIMVGLEMALEDQGTRREVVNPDEEDSVETVDIKVARKRFYEARDAGNLPEALVWLARMRGSDAMVPKSFNLDQREAEIQAMLKEQEEERRRLEVAEYLYEFVRDMVKYNDPVEDIRAALDEVWMVYDGYDPDRIKAKLGSMYCLQLGNAAKVFLPEPFEWCEIPEGNFLYGKDQSIDPSNFSSETSITELNLSTYFISKYPVTYGQYEVFVRDGGYETYELWTSEGWNWKGNVSYPHVGWLEDGWHIPDHPVVGVTMYEAEAFARWLSLKLQRDIRLPNEAEWEKAARGTDGRIYPYGNSFDALKSNVKESGLGRTTRVDAFPAGQSPYGVMDMSGNVYEWCLLKKIRSNHPSKLIIHRIPRDNYPILRGGSWDSFDLQARITFRSGIAPDVSKHTIGFRLVVSEV